MKTKYKIVLFASLSLLTLINVNKINADSNQQTVQDAFISRMKNDVISVSNKYQLYGSIMMSQAALESNWGQSQLSTEGNNYFGVKGSYNGQSISMPTTEYNAKGQLYKTKANFKKYPDVASSLNDNGNLLRNGSSWNPTFYSGAWKENAKDYQTAAKALVGKYATDPNYANKLINLISYYKLDQLVDNQVTKKATYAKADYNSVDNSQYAYLNHNYAKYRLYDSIKGTKKNIKSYQMSKLVNGDEKTPIYIDMKGVKQNKKSQSVWYRVRANKSQKSTKYWIYSKALNFPKVDYKTGKAIVTLNDQSNAPLYDNVYNSDTLTSQIGSTNDLVNGNKYEVINRATYSMDNQKIRYYQIEAHGNYYWITSKALKWDKYQIDDMNRQFKLSKNYRKYALFKKPYNSTFNNSKIKFNAKDKNKKFDIIKVARMKNTNYYMYYFKYNKNYYWANIKAFNIKE